MINIKRVAAIKPKESKESDDFTVALRSLNTEYKTLNSLAKELTESQTTIDKYLMMEQIGAEGFGGNIIDGLKLTGNALKSLSLNEKVILAWVSAVYLIIRWMYRFITRFDRFAKQAVMTFEKVQKRIENAGDIDTEAFQKKTLKLVKTDTYQTLFKTASTIRKAISSFPTEFSQKEIVWKKDMFPGLEVKMLDSEKPEQGNVLLDIKIPKTSKPSKMTVEASGWDVAKMKSAMPMVKSLIEAASEFKAFNSATMKELRFLEKTKKEIAKYSPDVLEATKKHIVIARKNAYNIRVIIGVYYQLIGLLCGQFFTLANQVKAKK